MKYEAVVWALGNGERQFFERVGDAEAVAADIECHGDGAVMQEMNGSLPRVFDGRVGKAIREQCPLWGRVSCPYEGGNLVCDRGWRCIATGDPKVQTNVNPLGQLYGPGGVPYRKL